MKKGLFKYLALGGILGSFLFGTMSIICGFLYPNYNPLEDFISELGASGANTENLMNYFGFIPSGIFFFLFGLSILVLVSKGWLSRIGSLIFMIFGIGMALAGVYSCDIGCPPNGSEEAAIHDGVSAITFLSVILGIILLGISFKRINGYRSLFIYTIVSGIISLALLLIMIATFESSNKTGLLQRLLLFTIFMWSIVLGLKIYKSIPS